jgi:tetratricopeptide (TPR) repeat protein
LVPLFLDKNLNNFYIIPKQYVFGSLVLINVILWVFGFVLTKEFHFSKTILDKSLLMFLLASLLSSIFSVNIYDSFFGRSDFFTLSFITLFLLVVFYYVIVNVVRSVQSWRVLFDILLVSGFISIWFFIGKNLLKVKILDDWFGVVFNTVDSINGPFGFWVIMILALSFGQLIKKNLSWIRSVWYFLIGLSALTVLVLLNFKILWWILLLSLALLLVLGISFLKDARTAWLSVIFTTLILSGVFIVFGVPKNFQLATPSEVALGFKPSISVVYDTLLSSPKNFLVGSGLGSFGFDFSKFRDANFNNDNLAWSLRFFQPYSTALALLSEGGILLPIALIFVTLLLLGHALTIWKREHISSHDLVDGKDRIDFDIFLLIIVYLILSGGLFFMSYNQVIWGLWFLLLALIICGFSFNHRNFVKEYNWVLQDTPQYSLSFSFGLIVAVTALVLISIIGVRFYLGEMAYAKALRSPDMIKAESYIKEAIDKRSNADIYHATLAQIYLNQASEKAKVSSPDVQAITDLMAKAINEAKIATDLSPQSALLWENLATMYENVSALIPDGREWAIKTLQKVIELEPTNPVHYWRLGNNYTAQAKWEEAGKNYQKAIDLKSDYYAAFVALANVYEQNQKNDQAIGLYEKLIADRQTNAEILYNYGRLLYNRNNTGDRDLAQKIWLTVLQQQPNYSNVLYSLGFLYETRGDRNTALQYYERVLELNPNNNNIVKKVESLTGASIVPVINPKAEIKNKK